jgi:hypothetical protein
VKSFPYSARTINRRLSAMTRLQSSFNGFEITSSSGGLTFTSNNYGVTAG